MATVEEIQKRRAARAEALEEQRKEQYAKDLEALDALESDYGHGAIAAVAVSRFSPGQPTRAFLRKPKAAEYKRYVDQVNRSLIGGDKRDPKKFREAQDTIAKSVWVYPLEESARDSMLEEFPGLLSQIAGAALKLAEGEAEAEGND